MKIQTALEIAQSFVGEGVPNFVIPEEYTLHQIVWATRCLASAYHDQKRVIAKRDEKIVTLFKELSK